MQLVSSCRRNTLHSAKRNQQGLSSCVLAGTGWGSYWGSGVGAEKHLRLEGQPQRHTSERNALPIPQPPQKQFRAKLQQLLPARLHTAAQRGNKCSKGALLQGAHSGITSGHNGTNTMKTR